MSRAAESWLRDTCTARTWRAAALVAAFALASTRAAASPQLCIANAFGAIGDGVTLNTASIQRALDAAERSHGTVTLRPGVYLTGSIFVPSGTTLDVPAGVTLIGSQHLSDYPILPTRIAGIEMPWPAALINVRDAHDVHIAGTGTIDGDGPIWWKSYWDLRKTYEPKGLRWAADYDARRPRLLLLQNAANVHIGGGLLLKRSGFWTVQVLYSHDITIDGLVIRNNEGGKGPSTDGIDIDSSRKVLVQNADIDVNDDALCLKAGRDSDGLRVNRPTEDVVIRDSIIRRGAAAITIGSETSGGFRNIEVYGITALSDVPSGVLFKSARTRGGSATDIRIHDLTLQGVAIPIHITMNWNPSYSYATLPSNLSDVPPHWRVLTARVPEATGLPHFRNVHIWNVRATGAKLVFEVSAYPTAPLENFEIDHVNIQAATAGRIADARRWELHDNTIATADGSTLSVNASSSMPNDVPYGEPH